MMAYIPLVIWFLGASLTWWRLSRSLMFGQALVGRTICSIIWPIYWAWWFMLARFIPS